MAKKKRVLDVWIIDLKTVYREVPFTVVTDWLLEGRLLPEDRVRVVGTEKWYDISKVPAFGPYLPKAEPQRAEDKAEALETVDLGFRWNSRKEEEDDDVDMIPLVDISLTLLIFFLLTASLKTTEFFSNIRTPEAKTQILEINKGMFWVGIDTKDPEGNVHTNDAGKPIPWFSVGDDSKQFVVEADMRSTKQLTQMSDALATHLNKSKGDVKLRIRADETLAIEVIQETMAELQGLESRINAQRKSQNLAPIKVQFLGEVSEPK